MSLNTFFLSKASVVHAKMNLPKGEAVKVLLSHFQFVQHVPHDRTGEAHYSFTGTGAFACNINRNKVQIFFVKDLNKSLFRRNIRYPKFEGQLAEVAGKTLLRGTIKYSQDYLWPGIINIVLLFCGLWYLVMNGGDYLYFLCFILVNLFLFLITLIEMRNKVFRMSQSIYDACNDRCRLK